MSVRRESAAAVRPPSESDSPADALVAGADELRAHDPELYALLQAEQLRQRETLLLVASCTIARPSVLACLATVSANVTAEGYPGARFHAGCEVADEIERLAIARACRLFGARYANVQPHSASTANQSVLFGLVKPGETILGMHLASGGHLSHGSNVSISGHCFRAHGYGLDDDGAIDYDAIAVKARAVRPKLIICGATAYPRTIDFARFRAIADDVGAYLLADISHVAGLVAAGLHPNPVDHAHVTTTCTHKQLAGPRGGLILCGRDADAVGPDGRVLREVLDRAVFPLLQGASFVNVTAAKANAFAEASSPEFARTALRIREDASALAATLRTLGHRLVAGGTDNHMVLLDLRSQRLTGAAAERALEACSIVVNRNKIPGDGTGEARGIRFGTNSVAERGMRPAEMVCAGTLVDSILRAAAAGRIDRDLTRRMRADVRALCAEFPPV